jgi:hypothetical protein
VANVHGLTAITGHTKKTSVAMHYFRFIRPGMVRVGVTGESRDVGSVACLDPESGRLVLVLLNRTKEAAPLSLRLTDSAPPTVTEAYLTDAHPRLRKNGRVERTIPSHGSGGIDCHPHPDAAPMTAPDPMRQVTVVPWPATLCSGSGRLTVTASLRVFSERPR